RRHTRFSRDWSSDVCSSDLGSSNPGSITDSGNPWILCARRTFSKSCGPEATPRGRSGVELTFWKGKTVLVTGHTGFKGSWLSWWLLRLGANVHGVALPPPTTPSLFSVLKLQEVLASHTLQDMRDAAAVQQTVKRVAPEIVFHLAAQPLVRYSYKNPLETYAVNVMGTAHLFEAIRHTEATRVIVNVTSDKCYENREWSWPY